MNSSSTSATCVAPTPLLDPIDSNASGPLARPATMKTTDDEFHQYPATALAFASDPVDGASPTRGAGREAQPSEPEVVSKLAETMLAMPEVGDDFLGFSLLAELGRGAFGRVFLAQQGELAGRLVALKVATGLFTESQTLAQLQHTNIVPIYSYHQVESIQAVCMPYLGSTTLADVLRDIRSHKSLPNSGREILSTLNERRRRSTRRLDDSTKQIDSDDHVANPTVLNTRQARASATAFLEFEGLSYVDSILWLAVRLTDGLAHAHERGILHRDLKPANILLTEEGVPMLLDFNLADDVKLRDSAAGASIGGTLPYMAPEHLDAFRGAKSAVDARSDVYSLGVILFELLTGAAPFKSYSKLPIRDVIERMIHDRQRGVPSPGSLNADIPPAVEAIVQRCLAANPDDRYQSARELQEDLQRHLANRPLRHAPNTSLWERTKKFRRRHPRLTSASTVASIAFVLFAALASLFVAREDQRIRLEARETLARFDADAQHAYFLLNARSAKDQLDEGERACRATLGHFQVLDRAGWRDSGTIKRLPSADQHRLEAEVGQLLILLAHAQQLAGERERDPTKRTHHYSEGLQFCSLATQCFPSDQTPQALWKQQGELYRRLDDRKEADRNFERARLTELRNAQDRYLTARQLAEEGKFREALPLIKEALRLNPQDFNLHFLQGICHDYLAQHAHAVECYRACIALRPQFHASYYNRGLSYLRQNHFSAAKEDFDEVLKLKDDFPETYVNRGLALQGMKKVREAEADFTMALERGHNETRIYFLRARLREKAGDKDGAKRDMAEGLRREPADEVSWIARGLAFLPSDPKRALHDFDRALELNPRSLAAMQNKAHVQAKYFKQTEAAIHTLDAALALYPDDAKIRAGRGVYFARLGNREAALKDAEQALLLDNHPSNHYQVAGIYALTSQKEPSDRPEAFRLLSSALKRGFGFEYLEIDHDLDPIREMPAFRRVIDAARVMRDSPRR